MICKTLGMHSFSVPKNKNKFVQTQKKNQQVSVEKINKENI